MRRFWSLLPALALLAGGCSLAGDVTPPPGLASQAPATVVPPALTAAPAVPTAESTASPAPVVSPTPPVPVAPPNPQAGAAIYAEKCAPCHGASGMNDGAQSASLPNPPPKLGDPAVSRSAVPADWYSIVTAGRMDRLMPPFGSSLSDAQRWDVVAYALTLSTDSDEAAHGKALYDANGCAACHAGAGTGPNLVDPARLAGRSAQDLFAAISQGAPPAMSAYADKLSEAERWALVAYVRSLAFPAAPPGEATAVPLGTICGKITNATPGGSVPADLTVTLHGFDGSTAAVTQSTTADAGGAFRFEGLPAVPGRIYGATTEYQGVIYFSDGVHLSDPSKPLDLPLKIYETTSDTAAVGIDRLHILFDFSVQGTVQVVELWVISNHGDRSIVAAPGTGVLQIPLPKGATGLNFEDSTLGDRYLQTDQGFADTEPLPPGSGNTQLVFSFNLPYDRGLDFAQATNYPVEAAIVLVPEGGPKLTSQGLQDLGVRQVSAQNVHTYSHDAIPAGQSLNLSLSGRQGAAPTGGNTTTNILIGVAALGVALILAGVWWYLSMRRAGFAPASAGAEADRQSLLQALAALDEDFENHRIDAAEYDLRRGVLKARLMDLMKEPDD